VATTVAASGLSCPQPVILAPRALEAGALPVVVLVDTVTARENVTRMAQKAGFTVQVEVQGESFRLTISKSRCAATASQRLAKRTLAGVRQSGFPSCRAQRGISPAAQGSLATDARSLGLAGAHRMEYTPIVWRWHTSAKNHSGSGGNRATEWGGTSRLAYAVILLPSTSHAMHAEAALKGAGIDCKMIPVPRHISSDCGVCIRIAREDQAAARATLASAGIQWEGMHDC